MTASISPPSSGLPAGAVVLLAAADRAALDALKPTGETLDAFAIRWSSGIVSHSEDESTLATLLHVAGEGALRAVIVASSDGTLPAALAARRRWPVVRVPVGEAERGGLDLLCDEARDLPASAGDAPFATVAIGEAGAKNAALFVVSILALGDDRLRAEWAEFRRRQTDAVLQHPPLADL